MLAPLVLLIEDDAVLGPALRQRLSLEGFRIELAPSGRAASALIDSGVRPAAIVSDIRLPDRSGEDIYTSIVERLGPIPTLFMTAFGDINQAVRLVKAGALDYLTKPVDADMLSLRLADMCRAPAEKFQGEAGLGLSPVMQNLERMLAKAARTDLAVLLCGETGVGKEVAANFLHRASTHANAPFLPLNCAAIPRELYESTLFGHEKGSFTGATSRMAGYLERAGKGTLLLDEIGEMPMDYQPKLLRTIQDGRFTPIGAAKHLDCVARLIFATNRDLKTEIREGRFREDLYYRIAVIEIVIPPLRARGNDVIWLAERFIKELTPDQSKPKTLHEEAREALLQHAWPGNVRELRNRIQRASAMADSDVLAVEDIFPEMALDTESQLGLPVNRHDAAINRILKSKVQDALAQSSGNKSDAARLLGVSRTTLWKRMKEFGLIETGTD